MGFEYNWTAGQSYTVTLKTARGKVFAITETAVPAGNLLTVEDVSWNSTSKTTVITVRNTGIRTRRIVHLYLGVVSCLFMDVTLSTNIAEGIHLEIDQTCKISLSWANSLASMWENGKTYYCIIDTETGTGKDFTLEAPP